jgi:parallel beta-helix repeat protein
MEAGNKFMKKYSPRWLFYIIGTVWVFLAYTNSPLQAATYYVATHGDDNRTAQQAQKELTPWRTLQKAVDAVVAGDSVLVSPGTYTEKVTFSKKHGSPGKWISVKGQGTPEPKVVGVANADGYGGSFDIVDSSYIEINGFEATAPGTNTVGIGALRSHHVRVQNCIAHGNGQSGIGTMHCDYVFVENNLAYNNCFTGIWHGSGISLYQNQQSDNAPGFHSVVRGNISHSNSETDAITTDHTDGNGIIIDDFQNTQASGNKVNYTHATLVENNLCYNNGAKGIQVYLSDQVTIRNNTCYYNNRDSGEYSGGTWRGELNHSMSSNNTWENNIAIANPMYNRENTAILVGALKGYQSTGNVFRHNLTFNGVPGEASIRINLSEGAAPFNISAKDGNLLGIDPQFINPGMHDFRLRSSSPARDAGITGINHGAVDLAGKPRIVNGKIDIGAYEHQPASVTG